MSWESRRITAELGKLKDDLLELGRTAPLVLMRGLNRAGTAGLTAMKAAAKTEAKMGARFLKRALSVSPATKTMPLWGLTVHGYPIPLIAFNVVDTRPRKRRGRPQNIGAGVIYQTPTYSGTKPHAFIAKMPSGHTGVFERSRFTKRGMRMMRGRNKESIQEVYGPNAPELFDPFVPTFQTAATASLLKNLEHEITFAKSKAAGATERPEMQFPAA